MHQRVSFGLVRTFTPVGQVDCAVDSLYTGGNGRAVKRRRKHGNRRAHDSVRRLSQTRDSVAKYPQAWRGRDVADCRYRSQSRSVISHWRTAPSTA